MDSRGKAKISAEVTHNHPEGVKGALAVTDAIFMCRLYAGGHIDKNLTFEKYKMQIIGHIGGSMATT